MATDDLYRGHPDEFVAARNKLAKELRDAGEREEADRVGKLRRPTVAAWLINRAALDSPAELERFSTASEDLADAQRRALEGEDEGAAEWRAAAEREQEATGAVVERAERLARDAGRPPSARALELAAETLRAASGDPELRERVVRGRVQREQQAATLGTAGLGPLPKGGSGAAKRRDVAQALRELKRVEKRLAAATEREARLQAQVDQTAEALRSEREKLAASKRETADLRRQVKAAQRRAEK